MAEFHVLQLRKCLNDAQIKFSFRHESFVYFVYRKQKSLHLKFERKESKLKARFRESTHCYY